jgi:hypothetical protein
VVWWQGKIRFVYVRTLVIPPFVLDLYFKRNSILEDNVRTHLCTELFGGLKCNRMFIEHFNTL